MVERGVVGRSIRPTPIQEPNESIMLSRNHRSEVVARQGGGLAPILTAFRTGYINHEWVRDNFPCTQSFTQRTKLVEVL